MFVKQRCFNGVIVSVLLKNADEPLMYKHHCVGKKNTYIYIFIEKLAVITIGEKWGISKDKTLSINSIIINRVKLLDPSSL